MRISEKGTMLYLPALAITVICSEVVLHDYLAAAQAGGGKGGGKSTTQTIQKADPWKGQQPYLKDVMKQAQGWYQSGDNSMPWGQEAIAPLDPNTIAGQNSIVDAATNVLPMQIASGIQANNWGLGGSLDVNNNPYIQQAVQGAINPVINSFRDQVLPGIRSGAGDAGQFGGSRQGIVEGLAMDRLGQTLTDTTSSMYSDAYNRGLDTFDRSLAMLPQTLGLTSMPGQMLDAVGQQNQNYQQQLLNTMLGNFDTLQNRDLQKLIAYQGLVQGNYGGQSSGTTTGPGMQTSPIAGALGGASMGAGLASTLGMSTPWGAGLGAIAGLLF